MKKQILFNPDNSGFDICRTIKTSYHKISTANLIMGGCYGASGVLEIEMKDKDTTNSRGYPHKETYLFNTDANGNARAVRACYGQCSYDSVFRSTGQGITGVMEKTSGIINIGQYDSSQNSRVISPEGISYAVTNGHKDGMPKIIGYTRDDKGKVVSRHLKDVANTVHTFTGGGWTTDQFVAEPKIAASRGRGEGWKQQLEINESGTSNTITSVAKDNYVMEPNVLRQERTEECKKLRRINGDKGMKFNAGNKEYQPRTDGMSNTLSTSTKDNMLAVPELRTENGCLVDKDGNRYRIRKLTPRECFRLQDVSESDIDKMMNAKIAKTNLYKLAGNSICISPMYHIFRKLFIQKECESRQLELF